MSTNRWGGGVSYLFGLHSHFSSCSWSLIICLSLLSFLLLLPHGLPFEGPVPLGRLPRTEPVQPGDAGGVAALPRSVFLLSWSVGKEPPPPEAAARPEAVLLGRRRTSTHLIGGLAHLLSQDPPVPADMCGQAEVTWVEEGHHVQGQEPRQRRREVRVSGRDHLHQRVSAAPAQIDIFFFQTSTT